MKERAAQHLQDLVQQAGIDHCGQIILVGHAKDKLLELIRKGSYDLVVMAKHNRIGIEMIAGSTTSTIVNKASCDVLVMHEHSVISV